MIRAVTKADIPAVTTLMKSEPGFWKESARDDALEVELASGKDLAVVWEENGQLLGFACGHDLGFRAYLSELIVARSARGKGIGLALIGHIERALSSRKCPLLFSDVWRNAEGFYRSLGWSEPDVTLLLKRLSQEKVG